MGAFTGFRRDGGLIEVYREGVLIGHAEPDGESYALAPLPQLWDGDQA
jgi:hypothetical protein